MTIEPNYPYLYYVLLTILGLCVFVDARQRRSRLPVLWAIGAALLCLIVVPAWYARRPLHAGEVREGGRLHNAINALGLMWVVALTITFLADAITRIGQGIGGERGFWSTPLSLFRIGIRWWLVIGITGFFFFFLSALSKRRGVVERGPTGRMASPVHSAV